MTPMDAAKIAAGLKSAYQIAQELGVTPQAVYKKIRQHKELEAYKKAEKYVFDEEGAEAVKAMFTNQVGEPVGEPASGRLHIEPVAEPVAEPAIEQLLNQLYSEIDYLRQQLDSERKRNVGLVQQLAELTRNAQTLQGLQLQASKPGFLRRLLRR